MKLTNKTTIAAWSVLAAAVMVLGAEDSSKQVPAVPMVAEDFECWEQGTVLVSGGWMRNQDSDGFSWFFAVSEILEAEEGKRKIRGRFRRVADLEMPDFMRMQRMDDAAFLKAFAKRHAASEEPDYQYWNEARDGAVFYHDNDPEDAVYHKPDISIPKDLTPGAKFRSFECDVQVGGYAREMAGPMGKYEAVRLDYLQPGEEIDGEEYFPSRVEQWLGRGLSNLHQRVLVLENEGDKNGLAVEDSRLLRVIRPHPGDNKK